MRNSRVNTYFAVLLITIFGSGAVLIIVEIATTNIIASAVTGNEASYISLQQSILKSRP